MVQILIAPHENGLEVTMFPILIQDILDPHFSSSTRSHERDTKAWLPQLFVKSFTISSSLFLHFLPGYSQKYTAKHFIIWTPGNAVDFIW